MEMDASKSMHKLLATPPKKPLPSPATVNSYILEEKEASCEH